MKHLYPAVLLFLFAFLTIQVSGQATLPVNRTVWGGAEPAGWTNLGSTERNTSFACTGLSAAQFDASLESRRVFFSGTPTTLTFTLKTSGMSGGSFLLIEESNDGVAYNTIGNYGSDIFSTPITSNICNEYTLNLASTTRYVRWTYTKVTGNCDLDDVTILGTPRYFRSIASGNWNAGSTWQWSDDNTNFTPAGGGPSAMDNSILIRNGHTVSMTAAASMKSTSVQFGGVLRIATTSGFEIAGTGDNLIIDDGGKLTVDIAGTPGDITGSGTARVKSNATVEVLATGSGNAVGDNYLAIASKFTYEHSAVFDWRATSTILGNNNYFKIDAPFFVPILRISVNPGFAYGGSTASTFNARLECNAIFQLQGAGEKTFTGGITGTGTVTQNSGGAIVLPSTSATIDGTVTINILNLGLRLPVGVIIPSTANIRISGPEDATIDKESGTFQVDGIADVTGLSILNTGMGSVAVSGTLKTSNQSGFYGTSSTIISGWVSLNPGCTIDYNRADGLSQVVTSLANYSHIKLSGSGLKIPTSAFNPNGNVIITGSAIFDCTGVNVGDLTTGLVMDGGRLIVSTTGTNPSMELLPYNISGGTVQFAGSAVTNQSIRNQSYYNIEVTGSNVNNSSGNITLISGGSFRVKTGGIFQINADAIVGPTGSQSLVVENGGIFRTGDADGFHGAANTSVRSDVESITLSAGSTVEYNRNGSQAVTNAGGLAYHHLSFSGVAGTKTAPSTNLVINGNLTNVGSTFAHNNGTVTFNGSAVQTYTSSTPILKFYNITNNNSAGFNINNGMSVVKQMSFGSASKTTLNGMVTLLSDIDNTANIGKIPSTATLTYGVSGKFEVERYIPLHPKAWQFLAVPVQTDQTVKAAWQEGATTLAQNPYPGYGTIITGHVPGNGFDIYTPIGPSMKTYDTITGNWIGIPNTDVLTHYNKKGYMLMVRGDRTVTTGAPTQTTLRTKGKIFAPGSDSPPVSYVGSGQFQSVGNPYASAIDFKHIVKTGSVDSTFYVWDPLLTGAWGLGAYQTFIYDPGSLTYIPTPGGGSYAGGNNFIESGMAFFIHSAAGSGSITFTENAKVSSSNLVTRPPVVSAQDAQLITNLVVSPGNSSQLIDGTRIQFAQSYADEVDNKDALKMSNTGENLSIAKSEIRLSVERRSLLQNADTIFYHLGQLRKQEYRFEFMPTAIDSRLQAFLVDQHLGSKTPIAMDAESSHSFIVDADPGSANANRFYLVFRKVKPLPTVKVDALPITNVFSVYPNPVVNSTIRLFFDDVVPGRYILNLLNSNGQIVLNSELIIKNRKGNSSINIPGGLSKGIYQLVLIGDSGNMRSVRIVIQ